MPAILSNFKIVPLPLDLVVEELCGGDGTRGGLGIWKGFGGGGDGFGRKRKRKSLLFVLYGVLVICGLGLLFYGDVGSNVLFCGLGFGLSRVAMAQWWDKIGIFAIFFGVVLVGLGLQGEELHKLGLKIRAFCPGMEAATWRTRRRRGGRRAF
ncbi:hypothetical protein C1H46_009233 [Malus baccata]|uniref:Uncharacterized protein n=1 Tax=Malus baccata TaxID=106549 RepID=A0A540N210_MALBA|nr:hypothetical protein C1H46_009233 [Malus baccata]